jgi:hypothetical protein
MGYDTPAMFTLDIPLDQERLMTEISKLQTSRVYPAATNRFRNFSFETVPEGRYKNISLVDSVTGEKTIAEDPEIKTWFGTPMTHVPGVQKTYYGSVTNRKRRFSGDLTSWSWKKDLIGKIDYVQHLVTDVLDLEIIDSVRTFITGENCVGPTHQDLSSTRFWRELGFVTVTFVAGGSGPGQLTDFLDGEGARCPACGPSHGLLSSRESVAASRVFTNRSSYNRETKRSCQIHVSIR